GGGAGLGRRRGRIREIVVSPSGTITLAEDGAASPTSPPAIESARHTEPESWSPSAPADEELDEDRQPDFLRVPDETELPEVDGNRADLPPSPAAPNPAARP